MARNGEVGKDTREVEELRAKWIWNLWRGARESGRRARTASSAVHGGLRTEKKRNGSASESEGRWRAREDVVDDLTMSPRRENGEGSSDGQRMAVEELREGSSLHTVPCAAQGEAWER